MRDGDAVGLPEIVLLLATLAVTSSLSVAQMLLKGHSLSLYSLRC